MLGDFISTERVRRTYVRFDVGLNFNFNRLLGMDLYLAYRAQSRLYGLNLTLWSLRPPPP